MTEEEKQELLDKAIRDYPVGTIFNAAHTKVLKGFQVKKGDFFEWYNGGSGYIVLKNEKGYVLSPDGNTSAVVFEIGSPWAKIVYNPFLDELEAIRTFIYKDL